MLRELNEFWEVCLALGNLVVGVILATICTSLVSLFLTPGGWLILFILFFVFRLGTR